MLKPGLGHLRGRDGLLFYGMLLWFCCGFCLTLLANYQGTVREFPFLVASNNSSDGYLIIDKSPVPYESELVRAGDEVRAINGMTTQGMSQLQAFSTVVAQGADGVLQLELYRGGRNLTQTVNLESYPLLWITMATCLAFMLSGVVAFLGTTPNYVSRCFFVACSAVAINGSFFFGLSAEITSVWVVSYFMSCCLATVFGFKVISTFPKGDQPITGWQLVWPWLLGLCIATIWVGVVANLPFRAVTVFYPRLVVLVFIGCLAVWFTYRNFRRTNGDERKQLKWVLLGTFLLFVPMIIVVGLLTISAQHRWLIRIIDVSSISYPVFWLIAILGYRAFDVDRVFSAVVTYTITIALALLAIVGFLPSVADHLINNYDFDDQIVYTLLSLLVCGTLIPLHGYLRPRIENRFFPERIRLEQTAKQLVEKLEASDSEESLIETLSQGLAELQGVKHFRTASQSTNSVGGYELKLQPSVGEDVYIHLGEKESGDVFGDRDIQLMDNLVIQSETLLLKMRNQALTLQRQAAEQLAAEKSLFLASASHDLRQPMHALGLFSESLLSRNRDERLDVLVQQIHRSTRALDSMFNSILDLSKIDAGAMAPEFGPVYVQLLFEELELEFASAAHQKGLTLVFAPSSAVIWSDANLLARVLRNLISNAIRYTDQGKILIGCRYGKDQVRLQVLDTGRGISEADQKRIFTAYARVDKHVEGGLGLGLSLVDKLCKLMDHPLTLKSAQGKGSMFSLTAATSTQRAQTSIDSPSIAWTPKVSFAGLRVLAVDDDPAIRLALTELLSGWGCEVHTHNSLAGVAVWLSDDPAAFDLALVDLHLAERQDGLRILEALFDQWGPVPAMLITGDAQAGSYKWINGVQVAIMNKPLAAEKLRLAMQETLSRNPSLNKPLTPSAL